MVGGEVVCDKVAWCGSVAFDPVDGDVGEAGRGLEPNVGPEKGVGSGGLEATEAWVARCHTRPLVDDALVVEVYGEGGCGRRIGENGSDCTEFRFEGGRIAVYLARDLVGSFRVESFDRGVVV